MLLPLIRKADLDARVLPLYSRWEAVTGELRADLELHPEQPPTCLLEYLDGIEPELHDEALQDLIAEHMRCTWRRGDDIRLETYVDLFGARSEPLADATLLPAELIEDEFLARHALPGGDAPSLQEYVRRFPERHDVLLALRRRVLGGRYVKLRRLGSGATAEVWEARDLESEQLVAIKQLRPEWGGQGAALDCFIGEAQLAARLDHPGIVKVHNFVQEAEIPPYLVLRLVHGRPLNELIGDYHFPKVCRARRETRALREELLDIFDTVCAATAHAHSRSILHRDLKAGNVVVEAGGTAVILDWGLATGVRDTTRGEARGAIGTPEFMAPEQARGWVDERSDVFGLGAILYETLSGHPLRSWVEGTRPADWRRVVREEPTTSPRRVNPRIPKDLEAICLRALAPDPDQRHASAASLLRDMRACREGAASTSARGVRRALRHLAERAGWVRSW